MRIIGLAGWSGSGKTTLLTKVIPRIVAQGKRVSTLKASTSTSRARIRMPTAQPGRAKC
jgi:molybdopterin-guanine dinucleotide biosynthesis protein MobB